MKTRIHLRSPARAALLSYPPLTVLFLFTILAVTGTLSALGPSHKFFYPGWWIPAVFFGALGIVVPLLVLPFAPWFEIEPATGNITRHRLGTSELCATVLQVAGSKSKHLLNGGWYLTLDLKNGDSLYLHTTYVGQERASRINRLMLRLRERASRSPAG